MVRLHLIPERGSQQLAKLAAQDVRVFKTASWLSALGKLGYALT